MLSNNHGYECSKFGISSTDVIIIKIECKEYAVTIWFVYFWQLELQDFRSLYDVLRFLKPS